MADLVIHDRLIIPDAEITLSFSRSGGPGGQHVNTTETRVQLRFALAASMALSPAVKQRIAAAFPSLVTDAGELLIAADRFRSRAMNIDDARERLADVIRANLTAPPPRRPTKPTRASHTRRLEGKQRRGAVKKGRGRVGDD